MGKFKNLINQKFGRLLVLERASNKNNKTYWKCQCDCGKITEVRSDQLLSGKTKSCGCLQKENTKQIGKNNFKDLTNQKFGKLTAIYPIFNENKHKYYWNCKCECGNTVIVLGTSLTSGNTKSCGCIKSMGEVNIKQILQFNDIYFISQYPVKIDQNQYFYDFAIIENNKITKFIEFDGPQHRGRISGWFTEERYEQLKKSDNIKNLYAYNNNIELYRIPYEERNNLTIDIIFNEKYLINNSLLKEAQEIESV